MKADRKTLQAAPFLDPAMTYWREVGVGIERIWENVLDWEHLPVLHETSFNAVELIEIGDWGWRAALTKNPGTPDRRMVLGCGPIGRMRATAFGPWRAMERVPRSGHC